MSQIPECTHRALTDRRNVFVCRHPALDARGQTVTPSICRGCAIRDLTGDAALRSLQERAEKSKPSQPPPLWQQVWSFTAAMAAFVADGCTTVDRTEYARRLSICDACEQRRGSRCLKCGCGLPLKARGRAFRCPLEKWARVSTPDDDVA